CRQQISPEVEHCRKHLKNCYAPPLWWVGFNQHLSHQSTFSSPSQHFLAILYPCCPSQGICPPCAVQTLVSLSDLLVGLIAQPLYVTFWMSVVHEHWTLCYYAETAAYIIGSALCGVSLLTMAAISVDRLLRALLAGLRYKEIVTLNSVCIIIANFWVLCLVASLCAIFDRRIITLLYSALWVQSVLVVCYTPYLIVRIHFAVHGVRPSYSQQIMLISNFSSGRSHTKSYEELICSPSLMGGHQQLSICFLAVYILLSITAFAGNSLILFALYKESSLHPPSKLLYRCLATTDLLVGLVAQPLYATYWMSVFQEHWSRCRYARDAGYVTSYVLILVSLMTMTAISVDRLLALLLGLRYKQIVTLKRTYIIVTTFWVFNIVASLCGIFYPSIIYLYSSLVSPFCLVISFASYTKIFWTLRNHQAQVGDQQRTSQTNALNMARFRKAVDSALWVQLALVVCYAPMYTVEIVVTRTNKYSLLLVVVRKVAIILLYFNSTLNPFLYCWKISEVRQAVKRTLKEALC
ncbi:unnamed protein product, partial [Pocillopora meandrina]